MMVYLRKRWQRKRCRRGENDIVDLKGEVRSRMGLSWIIPEESQPDPEEDDERSRQMSIADKPQHDRSRCALK